MSEPRLTIPEETKWEFRNGFIPVPSKQINCPNCDGDLHYHQLSLDSKRKENKIKRFLQAFFVCDDCEKITAKRLKIDSRRYAYFKTKLGKQVADADDIEQFTN